MPIKLLFFLCCMLFPLMASAQASGGQITRPNTPKRSINTNSRSKPKNSRYNNTSPVTLNIHAPSFIVVGDSIHISYVANTDEVEDFRVGEFQGFNVLYGPSTNCTSSLDPFDIFFGSSEKNGSKTTTITYTVVATKQGTLNVPAASIKVKGQTIKSKTTIIQVLPASSSQDSLKIQAPSQAEVGQRIRISYVANTQDIEDFQVGAFEDFNILYGPSTSRSSSFSLENGHTIQHSTCTFTYTVVPTKQGTLNIPNAAIKVNGNYIISETSSIVVQPKSQ